MTQVWEHFNNSTSFSNAGSFVGIKHKAANSAIVTTTTTMTDLIIDLPHQRKLRAVQFAETSQLYIYKRHDTARHEPWYTMSEYYSMKLAIREDVLEVRAQALAGAPFNYAGNGDASAVESGGCCIGIEHLLTPACMDEVRACRARCIRAVLAEQVRQHPSALFGWEAIALASLAQTRKAGLRARGLGQLHQDSI